MGMIGEDRVGNERKGEGEMGMGGERTVMFAILGMLCCGPVWVVVVWVECLAKSSLWYCQHD